MVFGVFFRRRGHSFFFAGWVAGETLADVSVTLSVTLRNSMILKQTRERQPPVGMNQSRAKGAERRTPVPRRVVVYIASESKVNK